MNLISQTTLDLWNKSRTKMSPAGWSTRNAPCCEHQGQTRDKRGRGGLKIDNTEAITIHCFNCSWSCSYTPGKPLFPKFQKTLRWLGISEQQLNKLKLESLRIANPEITVNVAPRAIIPIELPEYKLLNNHTAEYPDHIQYLNNRGIESSDFPFLVSDDLEFKNRIIVPFILKNCIIGYSARTILPNIKARFLMRQSTDFVFGMHWVEPNHDWIILSEGLFDALSVKGLAVMHNEINEAQVEMINRLNRRIICVPQLDSSGLACTEHSLIQTAIANNWEISFPEWDCKDINAAYIKYGRLFVIQHILKQRTTGSLAAKIKQKMCLAKLKNN